MDNKLNVFMLGKMDTRTLPLILMQGTHNFITGGCIYGNHTIWHEFNACMQKALQAFLSFNIMDDDQKLYIWCVRNYPHIFNILLLDDWFYSLFYFMPPDKRNSVRVGIQSMFGGIFIPPKEEPQIIESKPKGFKRIFYSIKKIL